MSDKVVNPVKTYTKTQAIYVMAAGGVLFALSMLLSTEVGTTGHTVKIVVGIIGVIVFFWGAYKRPIKEEQTK